MIIYINYLILFLSILGLFRMFVTFWFANAYDNSYIKYRHKYMNCYKHYSPTITIIVPAFNEEKAIYQTLTSVYNNDYRKKNIVVVDDGSSDNTWRIIQKFANEHKDDANIAVITQRNGGKSVAINNAILNYDHSDLTMVLDADSLLKKDAISKMVSWFCDKKVLALAMNVKMISVSTFLGICQRLEFVSAYRGKCAEHFLKSLYIIGGIGSTFRTNELKAIGGYDTNTPTEDIDLTLKIIQKYGNKERIVGYAHDAIAYTQPVSKFSSLVKQRYRWKYGRFVAFMKYRNLFFNSSKRFSKSLTFVQLPLAVFQELFMLIEPYVYVYLVFNVVYYKDMSTFMSMLMYVVIVLLISICSSKESMKSKLIMILESPLNFVLSYILTIVEYTSLIFSFFHFRSILKYNENHASWTHVERL